MHSWTQNSFLFYMWLSADAPIQGNYEYNVEFLTSFSAIEQF